MNLISMMYDSPVGELEIVASAKGLRAVLWPGDRSPTEKSRVRLESTEAGTSEWVEVTIAQLDEYFAGSRRDFEIMLDLVGTEFQVEVWQSLALIRYGETTNYGRQAEALGRPKSVRAVANANGKNPVSIVLPCHRVIGSDGSLTGFAGGLEAKRWLLAHESNALPL